MVSTIRVPIRVKLPPTGTFVHAGTPRAKTTFSPILTLEASSAMLLSCWRPASTPSSATIQSPGVKQRLSTHDSQRLNSQPKAQRCGGCCACISWQESQTHARASRGRSAGCMMWPM